jgi:hypothetical protein
MFKYFAAVYRISNVFDRNTVLMKVSESANMDTDKTQIGPWDT